MGTVRLKQNSKRAIRALYNDCCAWCGVTEDADIRGCRLAFDHIETAFVGGSDYNSSNFQILCCRCNSIKGAYSLDKLPPREPCFDILQIQKKQYIFKTKIMPLRRLSAESMDYPRRKD